MKKLLLVIIVLFPFVSSAQKLTKPAIDKLTGDTTWSTSKEKLYLHGNYLTGQAEGVVCWVRSFKGSKSLVLNIQTTNQKNFPAMNTGGKAYFKLADNSTVTLTCSANDYSISGSNVAIAGSAFAMYDVSAEEIQKLTSSALTFLRVETTNGNFDCDIKPKNAEMFKKQFELIAKY
ncbi:hypothetical protein [Mucilaginibacter sp. AK015]|uniref:hypothetical protein n=1 Tax=Mucilaginibacter sp. AK015 TaxID=2723072 RepID=UPI001615129D|nr:hypothetical protein [Mucilaginibacter sp. AK015]MBB5396186.1 hypothetical protein [Mucilaginibacter sp. AK015]